MVFHFSKPSFLGVEAGISGIQGRPLLHSKSEASLSQSTVAKSCLKSRFLMAALKHTLLQEVLLGSSHTSTDEEASCSWHGVGPLHPHI